MNFNQNGLVSSVWCAVVLGLSHNYLLIVYMLCWWFLHRHLLLLLLCFIYLFYSSLAELLVPESNKFWLVWTESETAATQKKIKLEWIPKLNCQSQCNGFHGVFVCVSYFFAWRHLGRANRPRHSSWFMPYYLYMETRVCVALQFSKAEYVVLLLLYYHVYVLSRVCNAFVCCQPKTTNKIRWI